MNSQPKARRLEGLPKREREREWKCTLQKGTTNTIYLYLSYSLCAPRWLIGLGLCVTCLWHPLSVAMGGLHPREVVRTTNSENNLLADGFDP